MMADMGCHISPGQWVWHVQIVVSMLLTVNQNTVKLQILRDHKFTLGFMEIQKIQDIGK